MKSIGKTYLIKIENIKTEYAGNILLPETSSLTDLVPYIGRIHDYGLGFSPDEYKDLIPIGTKVIMDYRKEHANGKIRLIFGDEHFYVYKPENILAIIEEE